MRLRSTSRRLGAVLVIGTTAALAAACASTASPLPGETSTPTSSGSPAPSSPPAATPTPAAEPTATPNIADARWVPGGDGAIELQDGTTLALPNGAALRIGSRYLEDETANPMVTQLWEPASGTWRETAPLPKTRTDFAAVVLRDGRVLVAGGFNGADASYSSAYLFDPATETWTKTGLMAQARTAPAAALLRDGRVLVAGGYFYAPVAGSLARGTVLARAPAFRGGGPGDGGSGGGGQLEDVEIPPRGRALATAEIYDPATGEWSSTGPLRFARPGPDAVALADGRVLVALASERYVRMDGAAFTNAEVFDPATGRFSMGGELPPIDDARIREMGVELPEEWGQAGQPGTLVALPDGDAVLVGHQVWWKHEGEVVRSFRFHAGDGTWSDTGTPFATYGDPAGVPARTSTPSRLGALVARLADRWVLVAGGSTGGEVGWAEGGQPQLTTERYDPAADAWIPMTDLPARLFDIEGVGLADGSVLLVGGFEVRGSGEDATLEWTGRSYRLAP